MLKFSVSPNYSEKLQQICSLGESQRKNFIILLTKVWLQWKSEHLPDLEVSPEIRDMIEEGTVFSHEKMIADWAEQMDDIYLDAADADEDGSDREHV